MPDSQRSWHFLTNHAHVLLSLSADPDATVRDLAQRVGITERAVMRIVRDLDQGGFIERERDGRKNHYTVHLGPSLRHPVENHCTVGDLVAMFSSGLRDS